MSKVDKELMKQLLGALLSHPNKNDPEFTKRNENSVGLILEALNAEDGVVLCIYGRSMSAGAALTLPVNARDFMDFSDSVVDRAIKEPNYEIALRGVQSVISDLIDSIEKTKDGAQLARSVNRTETNKAKSSSQEINLHGVNGATSAFIEFLKHSQDYNEIYNMWKWLRGVFDECAVDARIIFLRFENARDCGYDIQSLSSKLVNALMVVDWDETEVEWLRGNFAMLSKGDASQTK